MSRIVSIASVLALAVAAGPVGATVVSYPPLPPAPPPLAGAGSYQPSDDWIGDVWEMREVADWRGVWVRRNGSRVMDGYWAHPSGERVRTTLEIYGDASAVTIIRRHDDGQHCRYTGTVQPGQAEVIGEYRCTWSPEPMAWQGRIVRMRDVTPAQLRRRDQTK